MSGAFDVQVVCVREHEEDMTHPQQAHFPAGSVQGWEPNQCFCVIKSAVSLRLIKCHCTPSHAGYWIFFGATHAQCVELDGVVFCHLLLLQLHKQRSKMWLSAGEALRNVSTPSVTCCKWGEIRFMC